MIMDFDLRNYEPTMKYVYNDDPKEKEIIEFSQFLRNNKDSYILLYHGTSTRHDILSEGLLRTNKKRRNSYQSESGYVYLSVFPSSARMFGEIAYPRDVVCVYSARVKIGELLADKDQLRNKRLFGGFNIGNTLADSLIFGHGARIKRDLLPYELRKTTF